MAEVEDRLDPWNDRTRWVRIHHETFGFGYAIAKGPASYSVPHAVCRWDRGLLTRTPVSEIRKVPKHHPNYEPNRKASA